MRHKNLIRIAATVAALAFGGCISTDPKADPTRFYTLSPMTLSEGSDIELKVVVSQLPYYLSGRKLAIRASEYEVEYLEFHRWAEPLDVMIERKLENALSPSGVSGRLEVIFTRFEAAADGQVVLVAEWLLENDHTPVAGGTLSTEQVWRGGSPKTKMVESLGSLLEELASAIAEEAK
jgi:uncharacterized lipoprotein YmbA|tara:strand:- start:204 stop:737 length:534 start_codon:yes stop_codon:yes gene_type:complete